MSRALQWPDPQLEAAGVGVPYLTLQLRQEVPPVGETPRCPATESVQQGEPSPGWPEGGHQKKPVTPRHFVIGDFLVIDAPNTPVRFDETMTLKEDYDYCTQVSDRAVVLRAATIEPEYPTCVSIISAVPLDKSRLISVGSLPQTCSISRRMDALAG